MPEIIPFNGIRYKTGGLARLICPPYDVINEEERRRLLSLSKNNFVRIESPDSIGISEKSDKAVAEKSAKTFKNWIKSGILVRDKKPAYYFYAQEFDFCGKRIKRAGFFAALKLDEKQVYVHEQFTKKPVFGRLELMKKTGGANISPVFLMFHDKKGAISRILNKQFAAKGGKFSANADFEDNNKVRHSVSAVTDSSIILSLAKELKKTSAVIADGHHRYHTAIIYKNRMNAGTKSPGTNDYILAYLCALECPGVIVMATHRVARASRAIDERLKHFFNLIPWSGESRPHMAAYHNGNFFDMKLKNKNIEKEMSAYLKIPSIILSKTVLDGISAEDIIYTQDHVEAVKTAQQMNGYAFLVEPPPVKTVYDFSLKGGIMPPKTTYFYPKVPAGIVIYG